MPADISTDGDLQTRQKRLAASQAVAEIQSGMVVGVGAGSTSLIAAELLAARLAEGSLRDLACVPCSNEVGARLRALGIEPVDLSTRPTIDLTIDGADEVDGNLDLVKGLGGALLHEKMVAQASRREIIMVDESKLVPRLCTRCPLPVEVFSFGWRAEEAYLRGLGATPVLRLRGGQPFVTDEGNLILDCRFAPLDDPSALARELQARAGIAGHGIFLGLASEVFVGGQGSVRRLTRAV